ncbi:MAG: 2-C-methyl-D-erythritol 4-phosphate cytidylyltransferase [Deltaproteobacteria bacterium]|nr:2-C-methyl-D-erythritol 4-phosphate cytidylyltransferase [Deltaproteobacteria bacterium]MBW2445326.1 2-C-methyl-D-erythritol 4-phosphate cytidylyltransferase [Deltaproteobacteria bacterium]
MSVVALVLAAGRGERFGGDVPKGFTPLAGRSLLAHSVLALAASPEVQHILPVVPAEGDARAAACLAELEGVEKLLPPVGGGAERQDSMRAGLAAVPDGTTLVAVHDAARPLVRPSLVSDVVRAAREHGAALLAVPVPDTLKRAQGGVVIETPDRSEYFRAQTPQVFRIDLLREALAKAETSGAVVTDDASLIEALGAPVHLVPGDPENLKITVASDLVAAEALLARRRPEWEA